MMCKDNLGPKDTAVHICYYGAYNFVILTYIVVIYFLSFEHSELEGK